MLYLSDEAIEYAVNKCRRTDGYKVVVAVSNGRTQQYLENILRNLLEGGNNFNVSRNGTHLQVEFANGSYIHVLPATEQSRGYRAHLLVVDENIDDNIIDEALRRLEILEWHDRRRRKERQLQSGAEFFRQYYNYPIENHTCTYTDQQTVKTDDDDEFADVPEEEFMQLLNELWNP